MESVSNYIDHTNLSQTATQLDIKNLCKEAIENDFSSVCVTLQIPLTN